MADDLEACLAVFNPIEECYQAWFGLAPENLLTADKQSTYPDANDTFESSRLVGEGRKLGHLLNQVAP